MATAFKWSPLLLQFDSATLFGWIGCRIVCRSFSYCSLNHCPNGIRLTAMVSRLLVSRIICIGVLSVENHRLCSCENNLPVKFRTLPLTISANSMAEIPICVARRSNLRRSANAETNDKLLKSSN